MDFVNDYRGTNRYWNNKKIEHGNVKKKADRKSIKSSFNIDTSSENSE